MGCDVKTRSGEGWGRSQQGPDPGGLSALVRVWTSSGKHRKVLSREVMQINLSQKDFYCSVGDAVEAGGSVGSKQKERWQGSVLSSSRKNGEKGRGLGDKIIGPCDLCISTEEGKGEFQNGNQAYSLGYKADGSTFNSE